MIIRKKIADMRRTKRIKTILLDVPFFIMRIGSSSIPGCRLFLALSDRKSEMSDAFS